jgi:hypothetical protein
VAEDLVGPDGFVGLGEVEVAARGGPGAADAADAIADERARGHEVAGPEGGSRRQHRRRRVAAGVGDAFVTLGDRQQLGLAVGPRRTGREGLVAVGAAQVDDQLVRPRGGDGLPGFFGVGGEEEDVGGGHPRVVGRDEREVAAAEARDEVAVRLAGLASADRRDGVHLGVVQQDADAFAAQVAPGPDDSDVDHCRSTTLNSCAWLIGSMTTWEHARSCVSEIGQPASAGTPVKVCHDSPQRAVLVPERGSTAFRRRRRRRVSATGPRMEFHC